ncbi:Signal transduction histidine kinase [Noviherbaspirillum humi]|uniref:histidine kinase n=1 Tax=Noviherbaspirillum humi TaxID=1688639 RepID=A0A239I5E3_9BURK|nr:ATP-binding protein [Noviherbaspirillum humi]SNS88293.1 Signal transduction histidine kinase [Noviherbaspirillum humi]
MALRLLTLRIDGELDVVASRQRARQIAGLCGFGAQDQTRIATSVSELARNVYNYAGRGRIEFSVEGVTTPQVLMISIEDQGPGIPHLDLVLSGRYQSSTGMGLGLIGARRLMDQCEIDTAPGKGTTILLKKLLPAGAPLITARMAGDFGAQLASGSQAGATLAELQQQNQELLSTLAELKARQDEMLQLTRELEDTNRGVVALYAELDEKADHLRRADEMKSRFLSNMSHEFRTPLSSIRALCKLLLDRVDGELTGEQEKQIQFILKGSESLSELVNDLLDLAKIEAGKIEVRPSRFDVAEMFSALRGMLRPLLVTETVRLVFDEPEGVGSIHTDEAKVSQILRNFISNALKFTETGEVRVSAAALPDEEAVRFTVRDTGLGIAPENHQVIFEEFSQVENRLQQRVKGTGLGLPLCRKLAHLLGGRIELESELGTGSAFSVVLPLRLQQDEPAWQALPSQAEDDGRLPLLIVEDNRQTSLMYEKYLEETEFRPVTVRSVWEAEQAWGTLSPAAVLLDIHLGSEDTWRWLNKLKMDPQRRQVPVIIATEVDDQHKGYTLGADAYFVKPLFREDLLGALRRLTGSESGEAPQQNVNDTMQSNRYDVKPS